MPNLLARHVLGWDRAHGLCRTRHDEADAAFIERYDALIERRARREPVAYIRGVQEFWSRDFAVTPAVLIPRPETELIIEELLARLPADVPARRAARRRHRHRQRLHRGHGRPPSVPTSRSSRPIFRRPRSTSRASNAAALRRRRIASRSARPRISTASTGQVRFHPVESAVRDRARVPEPRAGSARIRAGAGAGRRRRRLPRHPADRRSRARRISRPAARCCIEIGHEHADAVVDLVGEFPRAAPGARSATTCRAFRASRSSSARSSSRSIE